MAAGYTPLVEGDHEAAMCALITFWGKAQPRRHDAAPWHPAVAHGLDVAAVGEALAPCHLPDMPPSLVGFLLSLHDIGKYSRPFQAKAPNCWPTVLGTLDRRAGPGHGAIGLHLLRSREIARLLDPILGGWDEVGDRPMLFGALTGHHGRPVEEPLIRTGPDSPVCVTCREVAAAHVRAMLAAFDPPPLPSPATTAELAALCWRLAGLAMLADWIGSAQCWFPYAAPEAIASPTAYLARAREQAARAVAKAGLSPANPAAFKGVGGLFPTIADLTPVQNWAATVPIPEGPALFVVEDLTGSGKTEAAVVLAARLMAAGRGDGLFMALPTMATANAMFERLAPAYRRMFEAGTEPSLALAHGRAGLHPGFSASILPEAAEEDTQPGRGSSVEAEDEPSGAQCAAWLADDRRRALLAQVGVGTVDQALLAALPVRHAPLRQIALARKVLVVDEAHAFDAYMGRELERLLRFHAALGGSVVLLSATLPRATRTRLVAAFRDGLGARPVALSSTAYPLATTVSRDGVTETPCDPRDELRRFVAATRLPDPAAAVARIVAAERVGAAVAWVRNSVDEAIEGAAALRAEGITPILFHARFAMGDRLAIERCVLDRFGKASLGERRGVVVATQVLQESLDLDFDLLVTDLAPADLLIQRAGRLWRHAHRAAADRPVPGPEMAVISPEPVDDPPADWVRPGVYRDPALLWRSARAVFGAGGIAAPEGLRRLVETAYDTDDVPPALGRAADRKGGADRAAASIADMNLLDFNKGYVLGAGDWNPDTRTPTRLEDEPQVRLRLARAEGGEVVPWCAADTSQRAWALSEVSVARRRVKECPMPAELEAAAGRARAGWAAWEREATTELLLAVLVPQGEGWALAIRDGAGGAGVARYDVVSGLRWGEELAP